MHGSFRTARSTPTPNPVQIFAPLTHHRTSFPVPQIPAVLMSDRPAPAGACLMLAPGRASGLRPRYRRGPRISPARADLPLHCPVCARTWLSVTLRCPRCLMSARTLARRRLARSVLRFLGASQRPSASPKAYRLSTHISTGSGGLSSSVSTARRRAVSSAELWSVTSCDPKHWLTTRYS